MDEPQPSAPRVLGRYALYDKIAAGGMATVHLGRLLGPVGFARTVAIKRMHPHFALDPEFVAMFLDEARLVARISHPNVVPTLDVVSAEGELLIVMEYVRGESLLRLIRAAIVEGSSIPPSMVAAVLVGVLHGLHAAHEAKSERGEPLGIVHRDVSPQNVLVGVDGVARVLDFGVAKAVGRLQTTREGQLKGKLAYMAPEQIAGDSTRATDIYAASVVLWEALAGRRLFVGENEGQVLEQVLRGCKEPPSQYAPGVSPELDALTLRGLSVDATSRFETARDMARALEDVVPLATTSKLGEWVERTAKATLDEQSDRIAAIESDSAMQAPNVAPPVAQDPTRRTSAPSPVVRGQRPPWLYALAAAVVTGGLLVGFGARRASTRDRATPSAPLAANALAPTATTLADLPLPTTKSPEAAAEYAAGMQALRDDSWTLARRHFERTVELDPTLAIAHLRLAMTNRYDPSKREEYAKAVALRAQLTTREQVLMEALEPELQWVRGDPGETCARLERASARFPLDVEFLDWLGLLRDGNPDVALDLAERAIVLDASDGQAWETKGRSLTWLGRFEEARAAFERCAAIASDSADCLVHLGTLDAMEGRCAAYEEGARRLFDRDPERVVPLASAMLATGRPMAAVEEVLDLANAREPIPARRASNRARSSRDLAMFAGDFTLVEKSIRSDLAVTASSASTRANYRMQVWNVAELVWSLEEVGKIDEARRVASEFVVRTESWGNNQALDVSLWLLRLTIGRGGVTQEEFERRRAAWIDQQRNHSAAFPGLVWSFAYAATALTAEEAQGALAVLPKFEPLTSYYGGGPYPDAYNGHVLFLAGRAKDAIVHLRRAVSSCNVLYGAPVQMRAALDLGQALEVLLDTEGACGAYKVVVDRWGHAKPRSATADTARARMKTLGCPP